MEEPKTKHLRLSELHAYLAQVEGGVAPDTSTRLSVETFDIGRPVRGQRAREVERGAARTAKGGLSACADDDKTRIYHRSQRPDSLRRRPWKQWGLRAALGSVAAALVALSSLDGPSTSTPPSAASNPVQVTPPAPSPKALSVEPRSASQPLEAKSVPPLEIPASHAEDSRSLPVDVRVAVDHLLGGDSRAALDSYRRLRELRTAAEEFALAVRILEREALACKREGGTPCTPR